MATRGGILIAAKADRVLPDLLDCVENGLAALLAYRVAKDAPEQPDVFAQRKVFVFGFDRLLRQDLCFRMCAVHFYFPQQSPSPDMAAIVQPQTPGQYSL
jgi:hypothetical protein